MLLDRVLDRSRMAERAIRSGRGLRSGTAMIARATRPSTHKRPRLASSLLQSFRTRSLPSNIIRLSRCHAHDNHLQRTEDEELGDRIRGGGGIWAAHLRNVQRVIRVTPAQTGVTKGRRNPDGLGVAPGIPSPPNSSPSVRTLHVFAHIAAFHSKRGRVKGLDYGWESSLARALRVPCLPSAMAGS